MPFEFGGARPPRQDAHPHRHVPPDLRAGAAHIDLWDGVQRLQNSQKNGYGRFTPIVS